MYFDPYYSGYFDLELLEFVSYSAVMYLNL